MVINQGLQAEQQNSVDTCALLAVVQGKVLALADSIVYSTEGEKPASMLAISIYSCSGKLLGSAQVRCASTITMNIAFLHKGLYFVKISTENVSMFSRLEIA
jgi:hypothetical protein